jgi:hypothetical protein
VRSTFIEDGAILPGWVVSPGQSDWAVVDNCPSGGGDSVLDDAEGKGNVVVQPDIPRQRQLPQKRAGPRTGRRGSSAELGSQRADDVVSNRQAKRSRPKQLADAKAGGGSDPADDAGTLSFFRNRKKRKRQQRAISKSSILSPVRNPLKSVGLNNTPVADAENNLVHKRTIVPRPALF